MDAPGAVGIATPKATVPLPSRVSAGKVADTRRTAARPLLFRTDWFRTVQSVWPRLAGSSLLTWIVHPVGCTWPPWRVPVHALLPQRSCTRPTVLIVTLLLEAACVQRGVFASTAAAREAGRAIGTAPDAESGRVRAERAAQLAVEDQSVQATDVRVAYAPAGASCEAAGGYTPTPTPRAASSSSNATATSTGSEAQSCTATADPTEIRLAAASGPPEAAAMRISVTRPGNLARAPVHSSPTVTCPPSRCHGPPFEGP
jgi:hypothetical protein